MENLNYITFFKIMTDISAYEEFKLWIQVKTKKKLLFIIC